MSQPRKERVNTMLRSALKVYFECMIGDYYISAGEYTDGLSHEDYISVLNTSTWQEENKPVEVGERFKVFCRTVSEYEAKTGRKASRIA